MYLLLLLLLKASCRRVAKGWKVAQNKSPLSFLSDLYWLLISLSDESQHPSQDLSWCSSIIEQAVDVIVLQDV